MSPEPLGTLLRKITALPLSRHTSIYLTVRGCIYWILGRGHDFRFYMFKGDLLRTLIKYKIRKLQPLDVFVNDASVRDSETLNLRQTWKIFR